MAGLMPWLLVQRSRVCPTEKHIGKKSTGINLPLEVSWYEKEPALSWRLIRNTRLAQNAPIIDVGGGASTLGG